MTNMPLVRSIAILVVVIPGAIAAQQLWLGSIGDANSWQHLLATSLPVLVVGIAAPLVVAYQLSVPAVALRESIKRFAAREPEPRDAKPLPRDVLGIRDAFDAMRTELDAAIAKLADNDRERRRLFADLAHELATPASTLLGLGDTLSRTDLDIDDAKREHLFRCLEGETLRVARLVEDIRDLAELDEPELRFTRQATDLIAMVQGVVDGFAANDGAPITLSHDSDESATTTAEIDAERIDQVLRNLLDNARRYTPSERAIRVSVEAHAGQVSIIVDDEGPGVPDDALARLGERLYRVEVSRDRERGGHGLGLSIAKAIVLRHGGTLTFGRNEAGGLRAHVRLPALAA